MTGGKVGAVAGELSSRLAHPAWPTGGAAVLALIAAVGILVLASANFGRFGFSTECCLRPRSRTTTFGPAGSCREGGVRPRLRTPTFEGIAGCPLVSVIASHRLGR